jgi:hypothetical protein
MKGKELLEFALTNDHDMKRYNLFMQKINTLDHSIHRADLVILLMEKF